MSEAEAELRCGPADPGVLAARLPAQDCLGWAGPEDCRGLGGHRHGGGAAQHQTGTRVWDSAGLTCYHLARWSDSDSFWSVWSPR